MSAIVDVLEQIVTEAKVYSYREKFPNLWKLDEKASTIVIVWDDIPPGKQDVVATSKYITPIDWAVAFSLSVHDKAIAEKKNGEAPVYPDLRIIILDLNSHASNADSVRLVNQSPDRSVMSMPWIRLFQPLDVDKLIDNLRATGKMPAMKDAIAKADMGIIRNVWTAFLTKPSTPGDHHAIANLVGPLLLLGDSVAEDEHVKALRGLMKVLGLIPSKLKEEAFPWINFGDVEWVRLNRLTNGGKINLILTDDQNHQGWGQVLCQAVGAEYIKPDLSCEELQTISKKSDKFTVRSSFSPIFLLEKIEHHLLQNETDKRFSLVLDKDNTTDQPEILFLDLRLFSGINGIDEEAAFFSRLLSFAKVFKESTEKKFPWPGFKKLEISAVQQWVDSPKRERESDAYITALTFLPRILALTDLSLPIVLFSSTGRRDLVEKFKSYGNIITVFEKPRFTIDISVDIAQQTKQSFQSAIKKCFAILNSRLKCRAIKQTASSSEEQTGGVMTKSAYIELFIDEDFNNPKKKNKINVGGCFAVFEGDTVEDAKMKADKFDNELVNNGIRYFDSLGFGIAPKAIKAKKESSAVELKKVFEQSSNRPATIAFIRLGNILSSYVKENDILNPHSVDNHYRQTLIALLELFFSETLPTVISSKLSDSAVSLFIGTRVKDFEDTPTEMEKLKAIKYQLGLKSFIGRQEGKNVHLLYSTTRESIFPIISDIMTFHKTPFKIGRVLGIKLPYQTKKMFPEHFVCRNCRQIFSIDQHSDIATIASSGDFVNIAQAVSFRTDIRGKKYGFIKPIENNGISNAIVFNSEWTDIDNAKVGQYVMYGELIKTDKGYQARSVRLLTEDERRLFEGQDKKYRVIASKNPECSCGPGSEIVSDYRALHYIADEILDHHSDVIKKQNYGEVIKAARGGFDDILDPDLELCIKASRSLDMGDVVTAISIIKVDTKLNINEYKIKPLLALRIAAKLDSLTGDQFIRLADNK